MNLLYTFEQLRQWRKYEDVRESGHWNMFDPHAIHASGLSQEDYLFVMKNYTQLQKEHNQEYGVK